MDWGWLKTSKSSSDSETLTISSSSSLIVGWEGVASSLTVCWNGNSICCTPSGAGLGLRKPGTTTLINYRR